MTPADRSAFVRLLGRLLLVLRTGELSEPEVATLVDEYFACLAEYALEEIRVAARAMLTEPGRVFFPTPGELIAVLQAERRRRRAETPRPALPPPAEPTVEERADIQRLLAELYAKLRAPLESGAAAPRDRRRDEPSREEWAAFEARKAAAVTEFKEATGC